MKCERLKDINDLFLLNDVCREEIESVLSMFDKTLLNVDLDGSNTFILSKDDDFEYSHKITASRMKRFPNKYALELTRTGACSQQGNIYYMTIEEDKIFFKEQYCVFDSTSNRKIVKQELEYRKTNSGFIRRKCIKLEEVIDNTLFTTIEDQESSYQFCPFFVYPIEYQCTKTGIKKQLKEDGKTLPIYHDTLTVKRDDEKIEKVYVTMNDTSFVSIVEGDTIPDYQTLLLNRVKDKSLNQIHYVKKKK